MMGSRTSNNLIIENKKLEKATKVVYQHHESSVRKVDDEVRAFNDIRAVARLEGAELAKIYVEEKNNQYHLNKNLDVKSL